MDEEYDVIILGTGLTECVLSGLLSVEGKKVLHMDRYASLLHTLPVPSTRTGSTEPPSLPCRLTLPFLHHRNDYYGAESASLNLTQLYRKFRNEDPPTDLGRDRDYAVDLIPKFMMANGEMTKMLVHTDVTRYLEFKQIAGSFVYRDGRISKVPSTEMEAVRSPLMGLFEKRRAKKFFEWVQGYKEEDPASYQGINLDVTPMQEVYTKFGLEAGTQDFIGHAMALHLDDSYTTRPARETYDRIVLYTSSMARYGKSPYIYPLYGLGELPQGFARLSAIYGGTYMLDKQIEEIVYDDKGKFVGVKSGGETVKAKQVIGDPSYFVEASGKGKGEDKVFLEGKVVRAICLLKHPIPNTDDSDSVQLIIPQNQDWTHSVSRPEDIYIAEVSATHNVVPAGLFIAIVSTVVETSDPEAELEPGLKLLGPIFEKFVTVAPIYSPASSGSYDNVFVTRSYDSTSHFETVCDDVRDVWRRAIGSDLVLKKREDGTGIQSNE
ncbi:Rab GDP dissociation inhibitor, partial [Phenoliferia sp. Uapishka_3]